MFENLAGLGWGIIVFAITIGVGTVVLSRFGSSIASCEVPYSWYNATSGLCTNASNGSSVDPSTATQNTFYLETQLGTSGLAGWAPAIIAFAVGLLFLGGLLVRKGRSRSY